MRTPDAIASDPYAANNPVSQEVRAQKERGEEVEVIATDDKSGYCPSGFYEFRTEVYGIHKCVRKDLAKKRTSRSNNWNDDVGR